MRPHRVETGIEDQHFEVGTSGRVRLENRRHILAHGAEEADHVMDEPSLGKANRASENWVPLAAGLKTAALGDDKTKILIRINRRVVNANFVVEVWSCRSSAEADITDGIAPMDVLTGGDGEAGKMAVTGGDSVAVIDHEGLAVSAHEIGERDTAIGRGDDRVAIIAADIYAAVKCPLTVERIDALTKASRNLAFNRPKIRSSVGAIPIGRGGVASHSQADAYGGVAGERGRAQGAQLIQRRADIGVLNLLLGRGNQRRLRFQSIKSRDLAGDRAQGCDLNVALLGNLFQLGITILQLFFFGAQLVIAGNLHQHARVGTGDPRKAEEADGRAHDEYIQVMDGDGNLT